MPPKDIKSSIIEEAEGNSEPENTGQPKTLLETMTVDDVFEESFKELANRIVTALRKEDKKRAKQIVDDAKEAGIDVKKLRALFEKRLKEG